MHSFRKCLVLAALFATQLPLLSYGAVKRAVKTESQRAPVKAPSIAEDPICNFDFRN